jgi:hypothetical protein
MRIQYRPESCFIFNEIRHVFIDGNTCDTIHKCYQTLQQQLEIPDYFGFNLDALEEVLSDLEWIPETGIRLLVLNTTALLSGETGKKAELLSIFNNNDNKRLEIVYLGVTENEDSSV